MDLRGGAMTQKHINHLYPDGHSIQTRGNRHGMHRSGADRLPHHWSANHLPGWEGSQGKSALPLTARNADGVDLDSRLSRWSVTVILHGCVKPLHLSLFAIKIPSFPQAKLLLRVNGNWDDWEISPFTLSLCQTKIKVLFENFHLKRRGTWMKFGHDQKS